MMFRSGLKFTQVALTRSQADKNEELADSFSKSYEQTLKKYHSFVVKPIFAVRPLLPILFFLFSRLTGFSKRGFRTHSSP